MRPAILIVLLLAAPSTRALDRWTWQDTAWEAGYFGLALLDWRQTIYIASPHGVNFPAPGSTYWPPAYPHHEINPVLGSHPSIGRVTTYFALTSAAHLGIALALPNPWRRCFQVGTVGLEGFMVARNYHLGVSVHF